MRPPAEAAPAPPAPVATVEQAPAPAPAAPPTPDPAKLVLIADADIEASKELSDALSDWGLYPLLVHDGVEAILQIQRSLPRVVVLDAALPRMFGFQVCELMKRNEQLRSIPVVLVAAIHDRERYRRPPQALYGADAYVERQDLPQGLTEQLTRLGIDPSGSPVPGPTPVAAPRAPEPAGPAPAPPVGGDAPAPDPETEKGLRLARVIVSDLALYNAEKFGAGVRDGNVLEVLADQLEEAYALFAQRVDSSVCDAREFVQRELVRVARSRGME